MGRRFGGGPLHIVMRWLWRALGLGFVLGAATGVRAARRGEAPVGARVMADRVDRALRVLAGDEEAASSAGDAAAPEGHEASPPS